MSQLDDKSEKMLEGVHSVLAHITRSARDFVVFRVTCGYRGQVEQDEAFASGLTKCRYPTSKHNKESDGKPCSLAVDLYPAGIHSKNWNEPDEVIIWDNLMKAMFRAAFDVGIQLRWGGSFNGGWDKPHFELKPPGPWVLNPRKAG